MQLTCSAALSLGCLLWKFYLQTFIRLQLFNTTRSQSCLTKDQYANILSELTSEQSRHMEADSPPPPPFPPLPSLHLPVPPAGGIPNPLCRWPASQDQQNMCFPLLVGSK